MNYSDFRTKVLTEIKQYLPVELTGAVIEIEKTDKYHDKEVDLFIISLEGENLGGGTFLENVYNSRHPEMEAEDIIRELAIQHEYQYRNRMKSIPSIIPHFDLVKENIQIQLVDKKEERRLLEFVPHKDLGETGLTAILNLYFPPKLEEGMDEDDGVTVRINKRLLNTWGKSMEEVYNRALLDLMEKEPVQIADTVKQVVDSPENIELRAGELFLLTNLSATKGANVLLYPNLLETITKNIDTNLYIIPSSIDEVLLLQDSDGIDGVRLQIMLNRGNDVCREEYTDKELSDHLFYYDKKQNTLTVKMYPDEVIEQALKAEEEAWEQEFDMEM